MNVQRCFSESIKKQPRRRGMHTGNRGNTPRGSREGRMQIDFGHRIWNFKCHVDQVQILLVGIHRTRPRTGPRWIYTLKKRKEKKKPVPDFSRAFFSPLPINILNDRNPCWKPRVWTSDGVMLRNPFPFITPRLSSWTSACCSSHTSWTVWSCCLCSLPSPHHRGSEAPAQERSGARTPRRRCVWLALTLASVHICRGHSIKDSPEEKIIAVCTVQLTLFNKPVILTPILLNIFWGVRDNYARFDEGDPIKHLKQVEMHNTLPALSHFPVLWLFCISKWEWLRKKKSHLCHLIWLLPSDYL